MSVRPVGALQLFISVCQIFAFWAIGFFAVFMAALTVMALIGWMPWPELALSWSGVPLPNAGAWAQVLLTLFFILLTFYLPANRRMARLEHSHRSFAMGIEDVSRAYRIAHASDRAGVFALSSQFDAVRARMLHLRDHPDLQHLEPELLQLAAQMSQETRDLARAYSDEKVERARLFLRQRQEEVQALTDRLAAAKTTCDELRRWMQDVDAEERKAQVQLRRLESDLTEILPLLGYEITTDAPDGAQEMNVVSLPRK